MKVLIVLFVAMGCTPEKNVYVCDSPGAVRYHYTNSCRGLSNCSKKIIAMPLSKAQKGGKDLCKWEREPETKPTATANKSNNIKPQ